MTKSVKKIRVNFMKTKQILNTILLNVSGLYSYTGNFRHSQENTDKTGFISLVFFPFKLIPFKRYWLRDGVCAGMWEICYFKVGVMINAWYVWLSCLILKNTNKSDQHSLISFRSCTKIDLLIIHQKERKIKVPQRFSIHGKLPKLQIARMPPINVQVSDLLENQFTGTTFMTL
jgi:hypothetical protein